MECGKNGNILVLSHPVAKCSYEWIMDMDYVKFLFERPSVKAYRYGEKRDAVLCIHGKREAPCYMDILLFPVAIKRKYMHLMAHVLQL